MGVTHHQESVLENVYKGSLNKYITQTPNMGCEELCAAGCSGLVNVGRRVRWERHRRRQQRDKPPCNPTCDSRPCCFLTHTAVVEDFPAAATVVVADSQGKQKAKESEILRVCVGVWVRSPGPGPVAGSVSVKN